jgi:hypothetical protein
VEASWSSLDAPVRFTGTKVTWEVNASIDPGGCTEGHVYARMPLKLYPSVRGTLKVQVNPAWLAVSDEVDGAVSGLYGLPAWYDFGSSGATTGQTTIFPELGKGTSHLLQVRANAPVQASGPVVTFTLTPD